MGEPAGHVFAGAVKAVDKTVASIAALVAPAPTCGRTTKAASPVSAARPNANAGDSRSKIG
jgi:hypothetical protein